MWSLKFEECIECKRTTFKHVAHGLCNSCYQKEYKSDKDNYERIAKQKRDWYFKYHENNKLLRKEYRESRWFSGKREYVLKRDGYRCTKCKSTINLLVHHKDGNGRGKKTPNNSLSNLETVCRGCHASVHTKDTHKWRTERYMK